MRILYTKRCFLFCLLLFSKSNGLLGQLSFQENAKKYTVIDVVVKGLTSMNEKDVIKRIPINIGQVIKVPGDNLVDVVKRLWKQRLFSSIRIDMEVLEENKVRLIFVVQENPLVMKVTYEGVKELSIDEVKKKSVLYDGMIFSEEEIAIAKQKIREYYESEGFFNIKISHELSQVSPSRVFLKVKIEENQKMHIEKILFYDNKAFEGSELEWQLGETVANNWWRHIFGRPRFKKDQFEKDKKTLISFYKEKGYRDARVVKDSVSMSENKEMMFVHIWLEEGPQYIVRNVTWEGNILYPNKVLDDILSIKKGDVYNKKHIDSKLSDPQETNISSLYFDRGYMAFRTDVVETVVEGDSIDINVLISEGDIFRIRNVEISGNTKTKDHVIRRTIHTFPGNVFSRDKVIRSIREIAQTNFFDSEKITPDIKPVPETNQVDIVYNLIEKSSDTFNASLGWAPTIGVTGSVGLSFKNFSAADFFALKGFYGDGQVIELRFDLGSQSGYKNVNVSFTEPWAFGTPLSIGGNIYYTYFISASSNFTPNLNNSLNNQPVEVFGASLTVGRRLPWPDDFFNASLTIRYQIRNGQGAFATIGRSDIDYADEFSLIASISRNSSDNPIYPRGGSEFNMTGQISGGPFLPGAISFWKTTFTARIFQKLVGDLVFVAGGEFGYMSKFNESDIVSFIDYFYMGGGGLSNIRTVPLKGYPDQSVGPYNSVFNNYGGKIYSKFSAEVRHPIILNQSVSAYAVTFFELGNVWADIESTNFTDLKKTFGVGVRIFLPILGLLGLDYAYGFDQIPSAPGSPNQGWRFVFTFGPFAR